MASCDLCGRHCRIDRNIKTGRCGQSAELRAARAALHFWEEPCISGKNGSGTVFFSGCSLHCVFCQNHSIAADRVSPKNPAVSGTGKTVSVERLSEIFLELQDKGAHNINLVTPTHFIPQIAAALTRAKNQGLFLPIVYNTGSYETVEALKMLDGLIDIYLPDLKYYSSELSARYSDAPDYFSCAASAIDEMFRQAGTPEFFTDDYLSARSSVSPTEPDLTDLSENCLMKRGVIVRHLLLPGCVEDSKKILLYLHRTYGDSVFVSIMSQYTPMPGINYPELARRITEEEYDELTDFALSLKMENVFIQDTDTAQESFIPAFDLKGI